MLCISVLCDSIVMQIVQVSIFIMPFVGFFFRGPFLMHQPSISDQFCAFSRSLLRSVRRVRVYIVIGG